MGERDVIGATDRPVTTRSLTNDLRRLGVDSGDVVTVHASLSAIGFVVGGAQAVVDALLDAIGPEGTLSMPAHSSDRSDPDGWENPPVPPAWREVIRDEMPAFDPYATPLREMGAVADALLMRRATQRSVHPRLSQMALGPQASFIVDDHSLEDGFGERSPLARLHDLDARVLLVGVGHANNTSLHLAEHRAAGTDGARVVQGSAMLVDGVRRWVTYAEVDADSDDFDAVGEAFAATGAEAVGTVGYAPARLMSQRALVAFATEWFRRHRTAP